MARLDKSVVNAIEKILERGNTCELKIGNHGLMVMEIKKKMIQVPPNQRDRCRDAESVREI